MEELTLGSSQSLLVLSYCDQGSTWNTHSHAGITHNMIYIYEDMNRNKNKGVQQLRGGLMMFGGDVFVSVHYSSVQVETC